MTIAEACGSFATAPIEADGADALSLLAEYGPDMTVLAQPDGRCRHVTPACIWLVGCSPAELVGTDLRDLAADADRQTLTDLLLRLSAGEAFSTAEFRLKRPQGALWVEAHGRRLPSGAGAVIALRDISLRKEGEAVLEEANSLLRQRATIDTVTGLLNRDHFVATLEREVRRAQRDRTSLVLLAISLNHFRLFTDLYGWETADGSLRAVADALRSSICRPGDAAGRLSGDEFAIVLPATDGRGAMSIARRVAAAVESLAIAHAGTASGILEAVSGAAYYAQGCDAGALLRIAHCAMRSARGEQLGGLLPVPAGAQ